MKNKLYQIVVFFTALLIFTSFATSKRDANEVATDLVCGNIVNKSESYDLKYLGNKYYFDSYDCRESFKTNPKNFIEKKCIPTDSTIDPVCGTKVDISESYDLKYAGKVYHFHSYDCKYAFRKNPNKFLINKCATIGAIK